MIGYKKLTFVGIHLRVIINQNSCILKKKLQKIAHVQHRGVFLGMLTGLAAKALSALLSGLATCLVYGAVEKAVGGRGLHPPGDGLYLHKSGQYVIVEPTKGNGL